MSNQADRTETASQKSTSRSIAGTYPLSHVTRTDTKASQLRRTQMQQPDKESRDLNLDINLPYRSLSQNAIFDEFTSEQGAGEVPATNTQSAKTGYKLVTFLPNDPENPKHWSKAYKWWCTMVVAFTCFVVAFASSVITADIIGVQKEFNRSEEVTLVSISIFVVGFGVGTYLVQ
jgi:hypothetical protein